VSIEFKPHPTQNRSFRRRNQSNGMWALWAFIPLLRFRLGNDLYCVGWPGVGR